jgi:hypothetical protein
MSFLYGLCAYKRVPLAEFDADGSGNYRRIARDLLSLFQFDGSRVAFDQDKFIFSCISETNNISIIVLSNREINIPTRFYAVEQIRDKFLTMYSSSMANASEFSKSDEFRSEFQRIFRECESLSAPKLAEINSNRDLSEPTMNDRLLSALEQTESLEVISQEEDSQCSLPDLEISRCRQFKWYILAIVVVGIIVIALAIAIGSVYK